MKLRPYQSALLQEINQAFTETPRVLLQLNTGGGKTVIFSHLATQYRRVLVVSHRIELVEQAANKLSAITGQPIGIIKAGYATEPDKPIQSASIQSLKSRQRHYSPFDLVIVDEAHHAIASTYQQLFTLYPDAHFLGVTATPIRLNGAGFRGTFDTLITGPTYTELRDLGYLAPYAYFRAATEMTTSGIAKQAGEYNQRQLNEANNPETLAAAVSAGYRKQLDGLSTIIFAPSVRHSMTIARRMTTDGIACAHLDGTTEAEERLKILKMLENREIDAVSNVGVLTEGYDYPGLEAIQICSPTLSLSKQLQMAGRVLRMAAGKERGVILDHTGNYRIHGLPCAEHPWTLDTTEDKSAPHPTEYDPVTGAIILLPPEQAPKEVDIEVELVSGTMDSAPARNPIEPDEPMTASDVDPAEQSALAWWTGHIDRMFDYAELAGHKPESTIYALKDFSRDRGLLPPSKVIQMFVRRLGKKPGMAYFLERDMRAAIASLPLCG